MAWIPLLLAGWIVVDAVIVAAVLAFARRRRSRLHTANAVPQRHLPRSVVAYRSPEAARAGGAISPR